MRGGHNKVMTEPTARIMRCPKCPGSMHSYERNGVTLEQCDSCRGIFLDFGELEALTRLEGQLAGPPQAPHGYPPQPEPYPSQYPPQPGWGGHGYGHDQRRRRGFGGLFYSS
jgi:uncharacterized protein